MIATFYLSSTVMVALWVAAWLHWSFKGNVRNFLFAFVFPRRWRGSRSASELTTMMHDEFGVFLAMESAAPALVRGALGCPGCLSAYISAVGTVLAMCASWPAPHLLLTSPLVWAAGAWVGHRLHARL